MEQILKERKLNSGLDGVGDLVGEVYRISKDRPDTIGIEVNYGTNNRNYSIWSRVSHYAQHELIEILNSKINNLF